MSGFLPDLANWALGGGAGDNAGNNESNNNNSGGDEGTSAAPPEPAVTEAEMRARRVARMEAMQRKQQEQQQQQQKDPQPMEDDTPPSPASDPSPPTAPTTRMNTEENSPVAKKSRGESESGSGSLSIASDSKPKAKPSIPMDPARKLQRKKELLIRKVLQLSWAKRSSEKQTRDPASLHVELDDATESGVPTIDELLAHRLSLPPSKLQETSPAQKPFIMYLATVHRRAAEEAKTLRQQQKDSNAPLLEMLQSIQTQVVSYASSGLMIPDMFEQASASREQLLYAMIETCGGGDPLRALTYGVRTGKPDSSFYHQLCDELHGQDPSSFEEVVSGIVAKIGESLKKCESIDSTVTVSCDQGVAGGVAAGAAAAASTLSCGPTQLLSALHAVCGHKKVATVIANGPGFLLPPPGTPAATETIQPPAPAGADIFRMLAGAGTSSRRPYKKRSGVGLEEHTLLGSVFKISTPRNNNPAFASGDLLRQSQSALDGVTQSQRRQIKVYQTLCNQLVMAFVKAGKEPRNKLFEWFTDCQLVNPGANAMRPDYQSKVSSPALLLNVSVALLKLCEPFMAEETKHGLIDPLFVLSANDNRGLFPTRSDGGGDDALPRLGDEGDDANNQDTSTIPAYKPKNAFIPQCFFYTARSLDLGIVPLLSQHESLLRHLSHRHWELNNSNTDLSSDPQFRILLSRQRSHEVPLFQEEMVVDTLRFCDLMAKIMYQMDNDSVLRKMPEHFVDNLCDILMAIAKMQPKVLRGLQFKYVFLLMVKLLSPRYAHMIRNYNLRAMLGDVLYELYLPADGERAGRRRDVPESISLDPSKGGRSYLLSDESAQESLAPSLLLLYGEVEYTGHYEKMSHRAKISSLLKYLWDSKEHRPAFQKITQNKDSFIKFANGIINETNQLISTVMKTLPEIKTTQEQMADPAAWGRLTEEEQSDATSRLDDNEREVKSALPLCNKTMQMFGYLNTDPAIRDLFLLRELCPRLVGMLIHVLGKLIGSKGVELKVKDPEQYEFRPKEMLRDLCAIFALFASAKEFQHECARNGCNPGTLREAVKTCQKFNLLTGESIVAFEALPNLVELALSVVADDEALVADAPDEFLDEIICTFMADPVILPSGHCVDRSTITQHLLNDPIDPFNREPMTIDDIKPADELKARIDAWLQEKRAAQRK